MTDYRARALPIVDDNGAIGEMNALSVCKALRSMDEPKSTIDRIMTSHPITLCADDPLAKAKILMNRKSIDHLPVLQNGNVVGVVTSRGLLDSIVPPERSMRHGWTPEKRALNRLSVKGLMERPFVCDVAEKASSVLN
jgi:CBS-domain-containing membrane protein